MQVPGWFPSFMRSDPAPAPKRIVKRIKNPGVVNKALSSYIEYYADNGEIAFSKKIYDETVAQTPNGIEYTDLFKAWLMIPEARAVSTALVRASVTEPYLVAPGRRQDPSAQDQALWSEFWAGLVNDHQTGRELTMRAALDLTIYDDAYVEVATAPIGNAVEFGNIDARWMHVDTNKKGKLEGYHQYVQGEMNPFLPGEVIHQSLYYVGTRKQGLPPLASAWSEMSIILSCTRSSREYLQASNTPRGLLVYGNMSQSDFIAHEQRMKQREKDPEKYAKRIVETCIPPTTGAQPNVSYVKLSDSSTDSQVVDMRTAAVRSMLSAFGATVDKDGVVTLDDIVIEWMQRALEAILNQCAKARGIRSTVALTSPADRDRIKQATYWKLLADSGFATPNEARRELGLPPSDDPNANKLRVAGGPAAGLLQANNPLSEPRPKPSPAEVLVNDGSPPAAAE